MSLINKKEISEALQKAILREDLHTRDAACKLNINPIYISLAKNPKHWGAMSIGSWERLEEWLESRGSISDFKIPQGEEIWKPKEKTTGIAVGDYPAKEKKARPKKEKKPARISPEKPIIAKEEPPEEEMHLPDLKHRKEKPGKSVKLVLNKAEIEALDKKFSPLFVQIENILSSISNIDQNARLQSKFLNEIKGDVDRLKTEPAEATLTATWHDKPEKKKRRGWSIVFFQRNIYQK